MRTAPTAVLLFAIAAAAGAEEAARPLRLGVVDMDRVAAESRLGQSYGARVRALQDEIEAERAKKQAELQKMDAEIKALQAEAEQQAPLISQEALERKQQEVKRRLRERQGFIDDGTAEVQKLAERNQAQATALNEELQKKVRPLVAVVARQEALDLLFDSRTTMALNATLDISTKVIAKLDAEGQVEKPAPPVAKP